MAKIVNDPVHGFIQINSELIQRLIDHSYFQRLRRISQLGLTHLVYPGAHHSRFHHALGAYHLMQVALSHLQKKGTPISQKEEEAACVAILLHDIGHGPFSHTLEYTLWPEVSHEMLSLEIMQMLNKEFNGALDLAIQMFRNEYSRPFFYQLISSQLDVDRLDYLKRDSFYSGVVEGNIGVDRILAMIDVRDEQIVVLEKGIMSVQHYLLARNLMYWQVYQHKTVMSAENMLIKMIGRVIELRNVAGHFTVTNQSISFFLNKQGSSFADYLIVFVTLDDHDIWQLIKELSHHEDYILSCLAQRILERRVYKVSANPMKTTMIYQSNEDRAYFEFEQHVKVTAYSADNPIQILCKDETVMRYDEYLTKHGFLLTNHRQSSKTFFYSLQA